MHSKVRSGVHTKMFFNFGLMVITNELLELDV